MTDSIKTAVIMAAGRGTRLKVRGEMAPKGFLQLGELPIIEESILRLQAVGVGKIVIVTGHLAEFYEELADRYSGLIRTVHNEDYADSGSMYSLYCAREALDDEAFYLLESDLIYESRALQVLRNRPESSVILLSGITRSNDEVWVESGPDGRLLGMSKDPAALSSVPTGELVGVSKLDGAAYRTLCGTAAKMFEESMHVEYEQALVAASGITPIYCWKVEDLVWAEIDDEDHLARAREKIYPRIGKG